jgi:hypothetical protein
MAIKKGKNGMNEELPDEYEVIQHSLRNSQDKEQQDSRHSRPATRVKKPAQTHQHKATSSSNGISGRNKH